MHAARSIALAIALLASWPAAAGMLYKSVGADGSIMFSDVPPPQGARILEQRVIGDNVTVASAGATDRRTATMDTFDTDAALARANDELDMAEHALAVARRDLWNVRDGLRLSVKRMTSAEEERVAFYRKAVASARQALVALLRERQVMPREPGAPMVVSGPGSAPPLVAAMLRER